MHPEMRINLLIKKVSAFIDNDTSQDKCRQLGEQAFDCLMEVVGSEDHPYAKMLEEAACNGGKKSLSTACGVLWATKLLLDNEIHGTSKNIGAMSGWRDLSGYLSS